MNLNFNVKLAEGYLSNSQIARVLTENWVKENSYCPCCGENPITEYENNRPVAWTLDPFAGSSTTGIATNLANRRYLGIDMEKEFLEISKNRKLEIESPAIAEQYKQKINGFNDKKELSLFLANEPLDDYSAELIF